MITTTIVLFLYVINAIGLRKMFEKAGIFGLWSFVPLLNIWLLFKIVYGTRIASLALLIPIINFFVILHLNYSQVRVYGQEDLLFKIISVFFPHLTRVYIGWSELEYIGPFRSLG